MKKQKYDDLSERLLNFAAEGADFIHKLQVVLKELRESLYWLKLIKKIELIKSDKVVELIKEANELINIIAQSVITAKKNK